MFCLMQLTNRPLLMSVKTEIKLSWLQRITESQSGLS